MCCCRSPVLYVCVCVYVYVCMYTYTTWQKEFMCCCRSPELKKNLQKKFTKKKLRLTGGVHVLLSLSGFVCESVYVHTHRERETHTHVCVCVCVCVCVRACVCKIPLDPRTAKTIIIVKGKKGEKEEKKKKKKTIVGVAALFHVCH